jgi:hypothetical protein
MIASHVLGSMSFRIAGPDPNGRIIKVRNETLYSSDNTRKIEIYTGFSDDH